MRLQLTVVYLAALLLLTCMGVEAQKGAKSKPAATAPKYVCLICKVGADKEAKCPICNLQMGKAGVYVCTGCGAMADKNGDCTACKKPMVTLASLAKKCKVCSHYSDKEKKECPICDHRKKMKGAKTQPR